MAACMAHVYTHMHCTVYNYTDVHIYIWLNQSSYIAACTCMYIRECYGPGAGAWAWASVGTVVITRIIIEINAQTLQKVTKLFTANNAKERMIKSCKHACCMFCVHVY